MNDLNPITLICLLLVILLIAIAVSNTLKRHLKLSLAASFILVGFVMINGIVLFKPIATLQDGQLQQLTTYFLLPILLADGAYRFPIHDLRYQRLKPMLLLPFIFLTSLLLAFLFFLWAFNEQAGGSLLIILAASFLIFMTDILPPHNTLSVLNTLDKSNPSKTRFTSLVQVQSLLMSVIALMFFLGVAQLTGLDPDPSTDNAGATWYWLYWLWELFGGLVFGFIWGVVGGLIATNIQNYRINLLLLCVIIWLSYLSSIHFFGVSGIMALLTTTLIMSKVHTQFLTPREISYMRALSRNLRFMVGMIIFGLIVYKLRVDILLENWFAMLMVLLVFILSRAISIYGFLALILQLSHRQINMIRQHVLFISTSHSSLILFAVWLLPADTPSKDTYEAMAFALVLLSLFAQRPRLPQLIQNLMPKKAVRGINLIKNR
ncbi:MAG: cation:proton antiporter [Proteobacteria bacterium]|nr:cation:proton antiporter [Pseudomonadota bacterium]